MPSKRRPYWLFVVLLLLLGGLQYRLWVGEGSLAQVNSLKSRSPSNRVRTNGCWSAIEFSRRKFGS